MTTTPAPAALPTEPIIALDPEAPALPVDGDTVTARPITHAEIATLIEAHRPAGPAAAIRLYRAAAGLLTPATLTLTGPRASGEVRRLRAAAARKRGSRDDSTLDEATILDYAESGAHFGIDQTSGRSAKPDVAAGPVGYCFRAEVIVDTGSTWDVSLFSSREAEAAAVIFDGLSDPGKARGDLYVFDPAADPVPLQPYFGSEITVNANVAGITPEEVKARVEKALTAEFGGSMRKLLDVRTRPVAEIYHDVYDNETGALLGVGILGTEVRQFMRGRPQGTVRTQPTTLTSVVVGG